MKCCKRIAWGGLLGFICFMALRAEANPTGAPSLTEAPATINHAHKLEIQAITRADGSIIDRITLPKSLTKSAAKSTRAASNPAAPRQQDLPDSTEAWLARMMDPTQNGLAGKNPEAFAQWLDAVTEPRFMTALAAVALKPETYAGSLGKMVDPATVRNWAEFADPQIYLQWMAAGLNPNFYRAIFNQMTESGKLQRWGLYSEGLQQTTHPTKIGKTPLDNQTWLHHPAHLANPWLSNTLNDRY